MDAEDRLYQVLDKLEGVRKSGSGWKARCPAHPDRNPSLAISLAGEKILLHCHTGCEFDDICRLGDIDPADLFPPKDHTVRSNGHAVKPRIVETYPYYDESGELLYEVVRYEPKDFKQRKPVQGGGWDWTLGDVRRVLYNLPELADPKNRDRWIFIVEGEKDVETLRRHGFLATTNVGGAGKRTEEFAETLAGRHVVVLSDNDDAGRKHAQAVSQALQGVASEVRVVELPGLQEKGDVTDWFAMGESSDREGYLKELVALAKEAEPAELGATPAFPLDVLPQAVRRYVEEAAKSVPIPPEMVAVPLIAMTGALIGNRVNVRLKRGWSEYGGMYMLVVAGPGTNKSAAIKHARWPIKALQREAKKQYDLDFERYRQAKNDWKAKPANERGDEPRAPRMRHYFTTDVTLEALAGMLENAPGMCISSDELSGWVKRMNQYRQGGDREQYLSIWATEPMKVDRKSGGSVYVETPVVSVFGGIQPDVVPTLHSDAQVRDGFVERLLPFLPTLPPKEWRRDEDISTEAFSGIADIFRALDALPLITEVDDSHGEVAGISVYLSPEANEVWGRWYNENNALARELGGFLGGFYIKLEAHVARFALILHCLKHAEDDVRVMIDADTMRDAIELGEYFRAQLREFLPMLVADAPISTKSAGKLSRLMRLLRRKGELVELVNGKEALCLSTKHVLQGLGITKGELTREIDTQNDSNTITVHHVPTTTKPATMYCLEPGGEKVNENTTDYQSTNLSIQPISVPTPPMITNGRVLDPDDVPW